MKTTDAVLVAVAVLLAACRIGGVTHEAFQAIAHVYVGGLGGAWLVTRSGLYAGQFWTLCLVEVLCFLADRFL